MLIKMRHIEVVGVGVVYTLGVISQIVALSGYLSGDMIAASGFAALGVHFIICAIVIARYSKTQQAAVNDAYERGLQKGTDMMAVALRDHLFRTAPEKQRTSEKEA